MEKLITPFKKNHFFGYYDKSPVNDAKNFLLSHEVTSVGKKPNNNDEARICVTNLKNGNIKYVDTTKAWNYQQGSNNRLCWKSLVYKYCQKNSNRNMKNNIYCCPNKCFYKD